MADIETENKYLRKKIRDSQIIIALLAFLCGSGGAFLHYLIGK